MKSEWRSGSMLDLEELKVRVVSIGWTPQVKTCCLFNLQSGYQIWLPQKGAVACLTCKTGIMELLPKGAIIMGSLYTLTGALLGTKMNVTQG
jgi:hypothetical protein